MLTDKQISSAIARLGHAPNARADLADPGERGSGRLHFRVRRHKQLVSSEWYAVWHRQGKRRSAKIGRYPAMSLADARKIFRQQYQPVILKGENPVGPRATHARGKGTVRELCQAYVHWLGDRPAATTVRQVLLGKNGAVAAIGPNRPAAAVRKEHIIPYLAEIHERGAAVQANNVRNILHAAFGYAIRTANSYGDRSSAVDWGLEFNPVSAIPLTKNVARPGTRALSTTEFRAFWRWLDSHRGRNRAMDALQLLMATGQRPCEILRISQNHLDHDEGLVKWETTKNGRPHSIPLPPQALGIFERLQVNEHGLYFWRGQNQAEPAEVCSLARIVRRYIDETGAKPFEARDLRRTWKTLAGAAGISKEFRDRIQNHALSDVSSRHYDQWEYMPQKRGAMAAWSEYLDSILACGEAPQHEKPPSVEEMARLADIMGDSAWRAAPQARHHPDWIGRAIVAAYRIESTQPSGPQIAGLIGYLVQQGIIVRELARDPKHREVPVYRLASHRRDAAGVQPYRRDPVAILASRYEGSSLAIELTAERLTCLDRLMNGKAWRFATQARRQPDWIGRVLADVFDIQRAGRWQTEVARLANSLHRRGVLQLCTQAAPGGRLIPMCQFQSDFCQGVGP